MQQPSLDRNSFSFSIHPSKTYNGNEFKRDWEIVAESNWRQIARLTTMNAWSPIVWRDGVRASENFLYSDLCGLDFDEHLTLAQGIKNFCDMKHFIGPSRSHQKEKHGLICDRFRVVIPWERRITCLNEYEYNMQQLHKKLQCDPKALDGGRLFFPCTKIVSGCSDGFLMEVAAIQDGWISGDKKRQMDLWTMRVRAESKTLSPEVISLLKRGAEPGQRNDAIYKVAKELSAIGCTPQEIYEDIMASPITKRGDPMRQREIETTILSAYRYVLKNLGGDHDDRRTERAQEERAGGCRKVPESHQGY